MAMAEEPLRAIDLCSGAGGVTSGYKRVGVRVIAAVDIDDDARASYSANHAEVKLLPDDLLTLEPKHLLRSVSLRKGELDILTACVPCQTFSSLGRKHRRRGDPRFRLVSRIGDFCAGIAPRALVVENVPRLAEDRRFHALTRRLRRMGYGVWFDTVDAADFGVPQRRRRLVLIALRGVADEEIPRLQPSNALLVGVCARQTVREAFSKLGQGVPGDLLSIPRTHLPDVVRRRIEAIPRDGGSRSSLPAALQLACHDRLKVRSAVNVYGRMTLDDVAPTLTTRCTSPSCGRFVHPIEDRPITLREAATLQTFPPDYQFFGGRMSIEAQIGNAVPPKLAAAIATLVKHALEPKLPMALLAAPQASSPSARLRMQRVRRRDTPAEVALRSALHRLGLRFRVDTAPLRSLRRRADVVFRKDLVAVFVDGCFWHGCPEHASWPRANAEWWRTKIDTNRRRDSETTQALESAGWKVVRVWEHEKPETAAERVRSVCHGRRRATARKSH